MEYSNFKHNQSMIRWKNQFRPKSLSLKNHIVLKFSLRNAVLFLSLLIKLNMYDMQIIDYGLKFIDEISYLISIIAHYI